jgi:hypothetical protein
MMINGSVENKNAAPNRVIRLKKSSVFSRARNACATEPW